MKCEYWVGRIRELIPENIQLPIVSDSRADQICSARLNSVKRLGALRCPWVCSSVWVCLCKMYVLYTPFPDWPGNIALLLDIILSVFILCPVKLNWILFENILSPFNWIRRLSIVYQWIPTLRAKSQKPIRARKFCFWQLIQIWPNPKWETFFSPVPGKACPRSRQLLTTSTLHNSLVESTGAFRVLKTSDNQSSGMLHISQVYISRSNENSALSLKGCLVEMSNNNSVWI